MGWRRGEGALTRDGGIGRNMHGGEEAEPPIPRHAEVLPRVGIISAIELVSPSIP
jgi:hypothetical protein